MPYLIQIHKTSSQTLSQFITLGLYGFVMRRKERRVTMTGLSESVSGINVVKKERKKERKTAETHRDDKQR